MALNHLMIDIETLDTKPTAVILSIAAVWFDPETGEVDRNPYHYHIDLKDSMSYALTINADTLRWWAEKEGFKDTIAGGVSLKLGLIALTHYVAQRPLESLWANSPSFDCNILHNAFSVASLAEAPWPYSIERDVRTIKSFLTEEIPFEGQRHNPVDDCLHQIKQVHAFYKQIGL